MISYKTIREGIADAILQVFPDLVIDDDLTRHTGAEAILVTLTDYTQTLHDPGRVHRTLDFDVIWLAPADMSTGQVMEKGMDLAAAFQPHVHFDQRYITVGEVDTDLVDKDFHVSFALDFYDNLRDGKKYDYMETVDFKFELRE